MIERFIRAGDDEAALAPCERDISVLFADIVGFTTVAEELGPAKTAALLNNFLARMSDAIFEQVGTVDKFQGREAPIVFYSMASSSGEDVPRGLDFLMSRNRLNVAVSRAQCLGYVACSPRLLEVDCRTVEQLKLANALCRFVEMADNGSRGPWVI